MRWGNTYEEKIYKKAEKNNYEIQEFKCPDLCGTDAFRGDCRTAVFLSAGYVYRGKKRTDEISEADAELFLGRLFFLRGFSVVLGYLPYAGQADSRGSDLEVCLWSYHFHYDGRRPSAGRWNPYGDSESRYRRWAEDGRSCPEWGYRYRGRERAGKRSRQQRDGGRDPESDPAGAVCKGRSCLQCLLLQPECGGNIRAGFEPGSQEAGRPGGGILDSGA